MALKPTIYKARIALSDLDRNLYESLNLTIALHPSETLERMVARILAYCLNAQENLIFCKGLSDAEEADLWAHDLNEAIELWVDVGEPAAERIKKACRVAKEVKVYSFNSKSDTWWLQGQEKFSQLKAQWYQFPWSQMQELAAIVNKTLDWSITISEKSLYVSTGNGEFEVTCQDLSSRSD
jgi:uncharacterized protein YaeQ